MQNVCTLYIVRHGETDWNVKKLIQGQRDISLNKKGEKQAEELAKKLTHIKFDSVFSSDLIRAKRTAEIIILEKKLAVKTTKVLRERHFGKYQGKSFAVNNEMLELINNLKTATGGKAQEVENDEKIISRLITFLREISVAYLGKTVLVVSHGGPIRALLVHLGFASYKNLNEGQIDNLAYVKLISDGVDFFVKETGGIRINS